MGNYYLTAPSGYAPNDKTKYGEGDHAVAKYYHGKIPLLKVYDAQTHTYLEFWAGDNPDYKIIGKKTK
ncbi:MAG: hypothetical protein J5516_00955 [Bacteroidales bacterium]|nr:hypothetical protein [Bacteroidales bacterium]